MPSPADSDATDEMLIVGNLRARLLGFPLLTIDVQFAVGPDASPPAPVRVRRRIARRRRRRQPRRQLPRSYGARLARSDGARLARSEQLVREATTVLDETVPRTG